MTGLDAAVGVTGLDARLAALVRSNDWLMGVLRPAAGGPGGDVGRRSGGGGLSWVRGGGGQVPVGVSVEVPAALVDGAMVGAA